ncbi:MAG: hypothetical protein Q4P71_02580 [Actinomycetaceae bacterium]|nr:hypothetical protein [Actinomycetaceae bacterium]
MRSVFRVIALIALVVAGPLVVLAPVATANTSPQATDPAVSSNVATETRTGTRHLLLTMRGITATDIDLSNQDLVDVLRDANVANLRTSVMNRTVTLTEAREILKPFSNVADVKHVGDVTVEPGDSKHAAQVKAVLDALVNELGAVDPSAYDQITVASIADATTTARLQFVATWIVSGDRPGLLFSRATHTTGLIGLDDLNTIPTPEFETGFGHLAPQQRTNVSTAVASLQVHQAHAEVAAVASPLWFTGYGIGAALGIIAALAHFIRRPAAEGAVKGGPAFIWRNLAWWNTTVFALLPSALLLNLSPWWRLPLPQFTPFALTLVLALLITALVRQTEHPIGLVAALTLLLLAVDVVARYGLSDDSVLGPLTMTFRRFYGVTNRMYIMLIVAGLLTTLPWLVTTMKHSRTHAARGIAGVGLAVLLIDALPAWGADFGGPPGIIAAFGLAYLLIRGTRPRWFHGLAWVALTVATMALMGLIDAFSPDPTHIAVFWTGLVERKTGDVLIRKASDLVGTIAGSPIILAGFTAALIALILLVYGLKRLHGASKLHRDTLAEATAGTPLAAIGVGIAAGVIIGALTNDSGTIMLADGLSIGLPALIAAATQRLHAVRSHSRENLDSAPEMLRDEASTELSDGGVSAP